MNSALRSTVIVLASLALGASVGGIVGYVMMLTMPCHWFGSSFEGACGYGALYVSLGVGSLVALVVATVLIVRYFSTRQNAGDSADTLSTRSPSQAVVLAWRVLLVVLALPSLAAVLTVITSFDETITSIMLAVHGPIGAVLLLALRIAHAGLCFVIARHVGIFPAAIGLVALIGDIGAIAAHAFLTVQLRRQRQRGAVPHHASAGDVA